MRHMKRIGQYTYCPYFCQPRKPIRRFEFKDPDRIPLVIWMMFFAEVIAAVAVIYMWWKGML